MSRITYKEFFVNLKTIKEIELNYLFLGKEEYLKEKAINKIKRILFTNQHNLSLDYGLYYADDISNIIDDFVLSLYNLPWIVDKRLVILKRVNFLNYKHKNRLAKYFDNVNNKCCFILIAEDLTYDDPLYLQVLDKGCIVNFPLLKEKDFVYFIIKEFKKYNKQIDYKIGLIFYELFKDEGLLPAVSSIEKICIHNYHKAVIKEEDIYQDVEGDYNTVFIYNFLDALIESDKTKALAILNKLKQTNLSPIYILSCIIQAFRQLFYVKSLIKDSYKINDIQNRLNISSGKAFYLYHQACLFKENNIKKYYNLLHQIDKIFKKSTNRRMHYNILELFVAEICQ